MQDLNERLKLATEAMESYNFGDGVVVADQNGWNTEDAEDFTKILFVEYDEARPEGDTHKVSFHVRFTAQGQVEESYALEVEHGTEIGFSCPATPKQKLPGGPA